MRGIIENKIAELLDFSETLITENYDVQGIKEKTQIYQETRECA